ncbi:MAG: RNA polymerase sigma factor [Stellaceae bacterium]
MAELLNKIAGGDRQSFAELYRRASPKLFAIAVRICGRRDLAEEVLQESFIAIWRQASGYNPAKGAPMTWLMTIVRHRAIDQRRRRGNLADATSGSEDAAMALVTTAIDRADRGAELRALTRCLDQLDATPRRAVMLAYLYGYSHEELATRLDAPSGTIKSWLRRSLERLKRCLDG